MKTPEIILLVLWFADICLNAYLHGNEKDEKYNFWVKLISVVISFFFLRWAGLFQF